VIARDDDDFQTLHLLLGITLTRFAWKCLSYCFMNTHLHLMPVTPQTDLDRGMQYLAGLYGRTFNSRHGRTGHLFGERYYAKMVNRDAHLLGAIRYVAMNPVRAGLCDAPERWRWGSYAALAGLAPPDPLVATADVLALFSDDESAARELLRDFVAPRPP
jgi:putative transposase